MKYKIVEGGNTKELEREVGKLTESGWEPIGGISVTSWMIGEERFWLLTQAMVLDLAETKVEFDNEPEY